MLPFTFGAAEKILALVVGLGIASAGGFAAGYKVNGWRLGQKAAVIELRGTVERESAVEATRQREALANALGAQISASLGALVERDRSASFQRSEIIRHEIEQVPVYSDCKLTPVVYDAINSAVADANRYTSGVSAPPAAGSAPAK